MKPIIVLPLNLMSEDNIKLLRENDICVVVAKDPGKVKFIDPIPAIGQRTEIENAAIGLSRIILNKQWGNWSNSHYMENETAAKIFFDLLSKGTPLDRHGSKEDQEKRIFDSAKHEELQRLAREEAKAERAAAKAAKQQTVQTAKADA